MKYIEVNISGIQSVDKRLPKTLLDYMNKYKITLEFINLEITETASITAGERLFKNMKELRNAGCHFSIDDFGTGYSNLSQVADINFDLIKKSLIWPCFEENGTNARVILNAYINMIHNLGIKTVAEGVETQEQAYILIEKRVEYLQGYLYSKPLSEEVFLQFIKEN